MADSKAHPSELLEFVSLSSVPTHHHIERTASYQVDRKDFDVHTTSLAASDPQSGSHDVEDPTAHRRPSIIDEAIAPMGSRALAASQTEHQMSFRQALHLYPKAIAWSACISLAIIMEGYDTALISTLFAFKEFQRNYGTPVGDTYQITPSWQAWVSNSATFGSIMGLLLNGLITQKFGYRHTMLGALAVLACCIFLSFFAFNIRTLIASQALCGLPWGVFSTLTTTYAAEVMPINLRVYLTSIVNMCWLIGQLIAQLILRSLLDWESPWSYRIPFGMQWVWILVVMILTIFAPESPWWLIQRGRMNDAEKSLKRLAREDLGFSAADTLAIMQHTNDVEKKFHEKTKNASSRFNDTSYVECFRGKNLRRTEIACMIFVSQNLCGLPIIGYAQYFYRQIGFDEHKASTSVLACKASLSLPVSYLYSSCGMLAGALCTSLASRSAA